MAHTLERIGGVTGCVGAGSNKSCPGPDQFDRDAGILNYLWYKLSPGEEGEGIRTCVGKGEGGGGCGKLRNVRKFEVVFFKLWLDSHHCSMQRPHMHTRRNLPPAAITFNLR